MARNARAFWPGLLVILLIAGGLRLWSYDFSLPLVDHQDEPIFYQQARVWRGLADLRGYLDSYPPVFIALNLLAQSSLEAAGHPGIAATVRVLRLLSVLAGLLALVCIALTARLAAGDAAGWAAGAAWGASPLALENAVYATPDPLVYAGVALALWLGAVAWADARRRGWCLGSFAAGLLAVLTKYPVLSALLPGLLVALWLFFRADRRRGLRYLLIMGGLLIALALFLLWAYPLARIQREGEIARTQGLANMLDAGRALNNLSHAIVPLQPAVFLPVMILGAGAYAAARRNGRPRAAWQPVLLAGALLLTLPWLAASFSVARVDFRMKDVLPGTVAACVLLGVGMAQMLTVPDRRLLRYGAGLLLALAFVPPLAQSAALAHERHRPDSRVELRRWADASLEPGRVLLDAATRLTFNREIGGIPGERDFDWLIWDGPGLDSLPLEVWRVERGLSYAVLPVERWRAMQASAQGRAYLATLLRLRDFASADWRGPQVSVYRLWRMQHETDISLAKGIRLVGYDLSAAAASPGEPLEVRFYWQAAAPLADDVLLRVQLASEDGLVIAQTEAAPGPRPGSTWTLPDETLISPAVRLAIPPDAPSGVYRLQAALGAGTWVMLRAIALMRGM